MRSSFPVEADGVPESGPANKTVLNSPFPVTKYCYYCNKIVWTKIKYYPTFKTRMIAAMLLPCLLCWAPFFCHWKAELDHHCSDCDCYLGTYSPYFEKDVMTILPNIQPNGQLREKKQPQKKYREAGRRCGEFQESSQRQEFFKACSDILQ